MKNKLIYPLIVAAFVACGGSDQSKTDQAAANYETVQEGSAAGVTSTIQGPGETVPLTGTNADTTSAFTLNPNAVPPAGQMPASGGTLAGTLPTDFQTSTGMPAGTTYRAPVTRTAPSPAPARRPAASQPATQPMYSSAPSQPQQQPRTATPEPEPTTDTTATQQQQQPPTSTDTATQPPPPAQTQSAPPAEQKPKKEEPAKPPAEGDGDAEATETAPPPPPPPAQ